MFPDDLYISDQTDSILYVVENDIRNSSISLVTNDSQSNQGYGILVCQNMSEVYTVNKNSNTVTRIRNGIAIGDIQVGKKPCGICEDRNGRIYVTNSGDNTVTIIENGQVVGSPIPVSSDPRGIVADYFGNIWVSCYMTNSVAKITNRTVVDYIPVAYNPDGITCSINNDIWVACSGSNCVVKITDGKKKLTLPTGKCPVAVVTDKKGHVFVANYEDDTVTMISTSEGNQQTVIAVGDGPSAIDLNSRGEIYVTSSLSSELVYKINPITASVCDHIHVCKSQSAYGDFTGCATYNVFNPNGLGQGSISEGAIANVIQALKPKVKVIEFDEDTNTTVKLDSDLLDLSKFARLLLNGKDDNENGEFVLTANDLGESLQLVGYFDDDGDDPIVFAPLDYTAAFKAYVGTVDTSYQNCNVEATVVDFTSKDLVTKFIEQESQGHLILFVPTRIFNSFKDGFMVQGSHDIGNTWSESIPDTSTPIADTVVTWSEIDTEGETEADRTSQNFEFGNTDTLVVTSGSNTLVADTDYTIASDGTNANLKHIILADFSKVANSTVTITIKHQGSTVTAGSTLLANIYSNDLNWSASKKNKYKVLVNTYTTNADEKWMFNFFNTLG